MQLLKKITIKDRDIKPFKTINALSIFDNVQSHTSPLECTHTVGKSHHKMFAAIKGVFLSYKKRKKESPDVKSELN